MACEMLFPSPSRPVTTKDLLTSFFIWIFVVVFWCGSWRLAEEYFLKGEDYYTAWIVAPVAATICVIITCIKPALHMTLKGQEESGLYMLFTRFITYVYACVYILQWVGVWNLINIYHGKGWENGLTWVAVCFAIAWVLGFSSTALRSPVFIRLDDREKYFKVFTRFSCPVCYLIYTLYYCIKQIH